MAMLMLLIKGYSVSEVHTSQRHPVVNDAGSTGTPITPWRALTRCIRVGSQPTLQRDNPVFCEDEIDIALNPKIGTD